VGLYLGECSEDCHSKLKATGSDFVEWNFVTHSSDSHFYVQCITVQYTDVQASGFTTLTLLNNLYCMHPVVSYIFVLMYQSTQQFCNKQISTTVLAFVYCAEVLLHVSTLLGHHQTIITWYYISSLCCIGAPF
jgi:hypothetical protein